MKKGLIIIISIGLLVAGCHRKPKTYIQQTSETSQMQAVELTFDSISYHDHPDAAPSFTFDVVLLLPNENPDNPVSSLLRRNIIVDVLGDKYADAGDANEALKAYVAMRQSQFEEAMAEMDYDPADNHDGMEYMFMWESMLRTSVDLYSAPLLVYRTTSYDYTGGAHGYGASYYSVYSTANGKRQQLNDVFLADQSARQALVKLVQNELRRMIATEEQCEGMEVFDWDAVKPTENFYITEQGITFCYPQYEIAAYCFGEIEITLPVEAIRPYLIKGSVVERYFDLVTMGSVSELTQK